MSYRYVNNNAPKIVKMLYPTCRAYFVNFTNSCCLLNSADISRANRSCFSHCVHDGSYISLSVDSYIVLFRGSRMSKKKAMMSSFEIFFNGVQLVIFRTRGTAEATFE